MASPSRVADVTASPLAEKKKEIPKNGKVLLFINANAEMNGQKSIQLCVVMEIHMHSIVALARRT